MSVLPSGAVIDSTIDLGYSSWLENFLGFELSGKLDGCDHDHAANGVSKEVSEIFRVTGEHIGAACPDGRTDDRNVLGAQEHGEFKGGRRHDGNALEQNGETIAPRRSFEFDIALSFGAGEHIGDGLDMFDQQVNELGDSRSCVTGGKQNVGIEENPHQRAVGLWLASSSVLSWK